MLNVFQCCAFFSLADDLQETLFDGQCSIEANDAIRLAIHDALGFSLSGQLQGNGADGSIITFADIETSFVENAFTADAVDELQPFLLRHNVTPGDLIQFASAVALTNCPGAPRLEFFAGRPNATIPAQDGSVPQPQDSVDTILSRFADVGLNPADVVNLDAWHSVRRIDGFVPGHDSVPLDTTPFIFDSQIFLEVLLKGVGFPFNVTNPTGGEVESPLPAEGEVRLQSDFALARDNRTACDWQNNIGNHASMAANFRNAFAKIAVVGQDVSSLIDCSEAVPEPVPSDAQGCL